jgi:hypothetical protein
MHKTIQLQLTMLEKEMQKVTKRMSQTIEFTQRLLKYSTPTEVIVFKPLLDSRLQGFLSFNADANQLLHSGTCEIRLGAIDFQQARQALFLLVNQLRTDSWAQSPRASPANNFCSGPDQFLGGNGNANGVGNGGAAPFEPNHHRTSVQQIRGANNAAPFDSASDLFSSLTAPVGYGGLPLATSAPTGGINGFTGGGGHGPHEGKVIKWENESTKYCVIFCSGVRRICWPVSP